MHIKRLPTNEVDDFCHGHMLDYIPHLKLLTPESDQTVLCWPETVKLDNLDGQAENDLDTAFIKFKLFPRQTGQLSSAIVLCSNPVLILNNSDVGKQVWTDSDGKLLVGNIDVKQYFEFLGQKLEHYQLEDIIDKLPDGTLAFRPTFNPLHVLNHD